MEVVLIVFRTSVVWISSLTRRGLLHGRPSLTLRLRPWLLYISHVPLDQSSSIPRSFHPLGTFPHQTNSLVSLSVCQVGMDSESFSAFEAVWICRLSYEHNIDGQCP